MYLPYVALLIVAPRFLHPVASHPTAVVTGLDDIEGFEAAELYEVKRDELEEDDSAIDLVAWEAELSAWEDELASADTNSTDVEFSLMQARDVYGAQARSCRKFPFLAQKLIQILRQRKRTPETTTTLQFSEYAGPKVKCAPPRNKGCTVHQAHRTQTQVCCRQCCKVLFQSTDDSKGGFSKQFYNNEGLAFANCRGGALYKYPILASKRIYGGGPPGPFRTVFQPRPNEPTFSLRNGQWCGLIYHPVGLGRCDIVPLADFFAEDGGRRAQQPL
jgi:hypothetical protein